MAQSQPLGSEVPLPVPVPVSVGDQPESGLVHAPAPFSIAPNCKGMAGALRRSSLEFWGWSADGRRYAFEIAPCGDGAADCEGSASFFIVDAETDTFVKQLQVQRREAARTSDPGGVVACMPETVEEAMAPLRTAALHEAGIVVGSGSRLYSYVGAETGKLLVTLDDQQVVFINLTNHPDDAFGSGVEYEGVAYRLELSRGDAVKVVEDGTRKREMVGAYSAYPGLFVSPDRAHIALMLIEERVAYEGSEQNFRSNGARLP